MWDIHKRPSGVTEMWDVGCGIPMSALFEDQLPRESNWPLL